MEVSKLFEQAKDGKAYFELWVIDVCDSENEDYPRKGIPRGMYCDRESRSWTKLSRDQAKELLALCEKEGGATEWAMCYDDDPDTDMPCVEYVTEYGPRRRALSYSGRSWEVNTDACDDYVMDTIYCYCSNDTGAVHYFEKVGGVWEHVM